MKKASVAIYAVAGLLAGVLLTLFTLYTLIPSLTHEKTDAAQDAAAVSNAELTEAALETAENLKNGDFKALAETVHPDYGVVFSPFATVNLASNLSFTARQVENFEGSSAKLIWGVRPDSGEPISMTVGEYLANYVTNKDYTCAPVVTVNYTLRVGNARENVTDIFPGASFVDLCYPGTEGADYADWSILRLVFEPYGEELRLAAVIHSEATV